MARHGQASNFGSGAPLGSDFGASFGHSKIMEQGLRLRPVGSRIVGEVFIGCLKEDAGSYLRAAPGWKPTLPSRAPGSFMMADLLQFAGVVPPL